MLVSNTLLRSGFFVQRIGQVLTLAILLAGTAIADSGMPPSPSSAGAGGETLLRPFGEKMISVKPSGVYQQQGQVVSQQTKTYQAAKTDQSVIYVYSGGHYSLTDGYLNKTGASSNVNSSNMYGNNAAVLATQGSHVDLTECTVHSDGHGANAVLAYGEGSFIQVENCTISTIKESSRGVHATYGGTITVSNSTISTQGAHSAALATDRGGGTVKATNVTATTQGEGSPGIYSTGNIEVYAGNYVALGSEVAVIEGKNRITLNGTDITAYQKRGVMLYQSHSGDSVPGEGRFQMVDGSLTNSSSGPVFFVTNTTARVSLTSVDIMNSSNTFLRVVAPGKNEPDTLPQWGQEGGKVTFDAIRQELTGDVVTDSRSSVTMDLNEASILRGGININHEGNVDLTLDESSRWVSPSNSYVNVIRGAQLQDSVMANIDAPAGVTIYYHKMTDLNGSWLKGNYILTSGGKLVMN
ncbi:hypothetical protein [Gynuella sunshinyii]|uniref:Right handed beta helix domain-containing protein n=1 Tax=Gynuella sunshinyii YC6258 TaxID=1445510 RepID=A0A0C5VQV2_9GAMM|nr:hypothetical protein [Gynuella sunshinyii]AJQ96997.1 hypothetical Protein YC6258_04965 [Gynuella sunshinyii YC6258]